MKLCEEMRIMVINGRSGLKDLMKLNIKLTEKK